MHLRILALTTSTLLLAACGGNDAEIASCAGNEFNTVDTKLILPESLAAHTELRVQLVSKDKNVNIAKDKATLMCKSDSKTCEGSVAVESAQPGYYTLKAYDRNGLLLGSTAVEIKKQSDAAGCLATLEATINPSFKTYVLNLPLSGALGETLQDTFGANFWEGQTDGIVMLSPGDLDKLNQAQKAQLKEAIKNQQYVVVTNVTQKDIETLGKAVDMQPVTLKKEQPYLDFIAVGSNPKASQAGFGMMPVTGGTAADEGLQPLDMETEAQKTARVRGFVEWLKNPPSFKPSAAQLASTQLKLAQPKEVDQTVIVSNLAASYAWTQQFSVAYNTGACDGTLPGPCTNQYQATANVWPVYVKSSANNISDYFIVVLGGNLAPQACYGWYRGQGMEHENRIAAYWAQHYILKGKVYKSTANGGSYWDYSDFQISPIYAPQTASNQVNVTQGVTWSLSGTGSVGANAAGPMGSIGFTAGVSFNNSTQTSYKTMATTANVASSAQSNPSLAQWDWDSKNYVKNTIVPSNHACGGPGFTFANIDSTEVSATFSPQATYLWQATKNVRETVASNAGIDPYGPSLPYGYNDNRKLTLNMEVDLGVLLGWAYWPDIYGQCDGTGSLNSFNCADNGYYGPLDGGFCAGINSSNAGMSSLIFDVGCGTNTEWGTMPLGPTDKSGGDGNPGQPKILNSPTLNVPFADANAAP